MSKNIMFYAIVHSTKQGTYLGKYTLWVLARKAVKDYIMAECIDNSWDVGRIEGNVVNSETGEILDWILSTVSSDRKACCSNSIESYNG